MFDSDIKLKNIIWSFEQRTYKEVLTEHKASLDFFHMNQLQ